MANGEIFFSIDDISITRRYCAPLPSITAVAIDYTALKFQWGAVPGAIAYEHQLNQVDPAPPTTGSIIYTTSTIANYTGLPSGITFDFKVRSVCANGQRTGWTVRSVKTLGRPPGSLATNASGSNSIFSISPNPVKDRLNISLNTLDKTILYIYSAKGRIEKKVTLSKSLHTIDLEGLPKGTYYIKASDSKGTITKRFLKE